jgi:hypothetical protein
MFTAIGNITIWTFEKLMSVHRAFQARITRKIQMRIAEEELNLQKIREQQTKDRLFKEHIKEMNNQRANRLLQEAKDKLETEKQNRWKTFKNQRDNMLRQLLEQPNVTENTAVNVDNELMTIAELRRRLGE